MDLSLYIVYVLLVVVAAVFGVFIVIKLRTHNKIMAFFVEKDKGLRYKMFKPQTQLFTFKGKELREKYYIDPERVMLVQYPFGFPGILQASVKCLIYARNNPEPLSPKDVAVMPKTTTAKALASAMDEHIIDKIVQATEEGRQKRMVDWVLPAITIAMVAILAIMMFMQRSQVGHMESMLKDVLEYLEAVK